MPPVSSKLLAPALLFATAAASAGVALLASTPAFAACKVSTTGVNFGSYNPKSGSALDGAGTINVSCDKIDKSATTSIGTGGSGTYTSRRMTSGANILQYNLYTSAARTQVWGDGTGGTGTITVSPAEGAHALTVYGRVPASQNVGAGSYGDSAVVTVVF